jgi:hypothetical protein
MGGAQCAASSGGENDHNLRCTNRYGGNTFWGQHNQSRASKFYKSSKFSQVIRFIDVDGNSHMVRQRGQIQTTSHTLVLQALSHRAGNLYATNTTEARDWSIDEMGTLDTLGLDICKENEILQQEISKLNAIPVQEEVLQIHGFVSPKKAKRNVCLIYENVNGLNTCLHDNEKVERMKEIHDKLEINIAAYCNITNSNIVDIKQND